MSIHFVIEMQREQTAQSVMRALESYKARLRNGVERTRRRLADFETRYQVTTAQFLKKMTAEDLAGGDTTRVSVASDGAQGNNEAEKTSISTALSSSPVMFIENVGRFEADALTS